MANKYGGLLSSKSFSICNRGSRDTLPISVCLCPLYSFSEFIKKSATVIIRPPYEIHSLLHFFLKLTPSYLPTHPQGRGYYCLIIIFKFVNRITLVIFRSSIL